MLIKQQLGDEYLEAGM